MAAMGVLLVVLVAAIATMTACGRSHPDDSPVRASPAPSRAQTWTPTPSGPWQWQLAGPLDLSVDVPAYDLDGQETSAATVAELHRRGRRAICYVSVGSWERWRPDAGAFPASVIGRPLDGWPDESWLDVRRLDRLRGPLGRRLDECRTKGFDAVEPDNVDGYENDSGFALTASDQLRFNRWVAGAVRARGMSVALKNDPDQAGALVEAFDFAVVEECVPRDECAAYRPFVAAGKAVLHVEYVEPDSGTGSDDENCAVPGFSSMRKHLDLDAWRRPC
jgi:hypothetical protein